MRRAVPSIVLALALGGCVSSGQHALEEARADRLEQAYFEAHDARAGLEQRLEQLRQTNEAMSRTILALASNVEQAESEQSALRSSLVVANQGLRVSAEERGSLSEDLERVRLSLVSAERSLSELRARERAARERAATFHALLAQMRDLIESRQVNVVVRRNRMVVELPEGVLFESGRDEIREAGQRVLEQISGVLVGLEERDFQVAGHTDDVPIRTRRFPSNWELSTARALNVAAFLRGHGMPAERISVAGFAETQPVGDNRTAEGRASNRRTEIVLLPRLDELPDLSALESSPR